MKYIRKYHKLTQEQLAQELNVSRKTISAWENDRGIPDYHLVKYIEGKFQISNDCLLDNNKPLFMDSRELKNEFKDKIKWVLYIEIIFIFLGYLTLFKIYNNTINTIILMILTYYLNKTVKVYYPQNNSHSITKIGIFLIHILVGIWKLAEYISKYMLDENIYYICGLGISLVIVSFTVTCALVVTLRILTILKYE
ncbi:helix-turn-helix transcriptional regulator [Holzapfeliella sp. He02]|uniref:Helix-turn-helix transcriptional regulator n=1 Tax=Holzapfeliella saturejae TaxID=3082953 RepID=A0ABU8SGE5_9LACO